MEQLQHELKKAENYVMQLTTMLEQSAGDDDTEESGGGKSTRQHTHNILSYATDKNILLILFPTIL